MPVGGFYGFKSKSVSSGGAAPSSELQQSREDLRFGSVSSGTIATPSAFYRFGEDAGFARLDTSGNAYDLSDGGTVAVGTASGAAGVGLQFDGTSHQYLNIADNAAFSGGAQDKSFVVWVKVSAIPGSFDRCVFSKGRISTNREYRLWLATVDKFRFTVYDSTGTAYSVTSDDYDAISSHLNEWLMVHCYIDDAGKTIGISVNGGVITSAAMGANSVRDSTDDFRVGIVDQLSATASVRQLWLDYIDSLSMYSSLLGTADIATLAANQGAEYYSGAWHGITGGGTTFYPVFVLGVDNIDSTDPVFYVP